MSRGTRGAHLSRPRGFLNAEVGESQKIAFASARDRDYKWHFQVCVMKADGTGQAQLTHSHGGHSQEPAWWGPH